MQNENPYSSSQIRADRREIADWPVDEELESMMRTKLMTLRIIVGSLTAGVLAFGGFVAFQMISQNKPFNGWGVGTSGKFLFGFSIFLIVISFISPKIITATSLKEARKKSNSQPVDSNKVELFAGLFNVLQTETIIRAALLEAAGFLSLTEVMQTQVLPLVFIAGIVVLRLFSIFPRYEAVRGRLMQYLRGSQES